MSGVARFFLVVVLTLVLVCIALAGPSVSGRAASTQDDKPIDVSGNWSGNIVSSVSYSPLPLYFKLQQTQQGITGTAGPSAEYQYPIAKVERDGNRMKLEVTSSDGLKFKFDLAIEKDRLKGNAFGERSDGKIPGTATLTRVKQ